ncbi:unnamed protein product [Ceutorhynchus assimilis]|uniref:Odorant receptor n=1 Tax=Ceutorhynchus assimilis TaxID=467358 RepID=A0A9N9QT51_9CUCU|nr:unnamed protein product [Ceutorhynchus assimilis]
MSNMFEFIKIPRILLSIMAIYPTTEFSLVYRIRTIISMGTLFALVLCLSYEVALQVGNFVKLSESLYLHITIFNSFFKFVIMTYKREEFFKCIDMLETPSFVAYNDQYNSVLRQLKKFCVGIQATCFIQLNIALFCLAVYPIWESNKPLPVEFKYFNSGMFYYPFYMFEVIGEYICGYTNLSLDLLSVGFLMISATQLRKLNMKLIDMKKNVKSLPDYSEENSEKFYLDYLKECCIHYSDIEEFSKCIQDCFGIISSIQMVTGCISICNTLMLLTSLSPISPKAIALISYTTCMLAELGLYCWFGSFVSHESLEILTSCYFSSWYEYSPRVRCSLFILMERTKRPIEVKGFNLIMLSLETFISSALLQLAKLLALHFT